MVWNNYENCEENNKLTHALKYVSQEFKRCMQCGKCVGICPAGEISDFNSRKIIHSIKLGNIKTTLENNNIWHCVLCSSCYAVCPNNINFPLSIMILRVISFYYGFGWKLDNISIPYVEQCLKTGMSLPDNESDEIKDVLKENYGKDASMPEIRDRIGLKPKRKVSDKAIAEINQLAEISGLIRKTNIVKSCNPENEGDLRSLDWEQECREFFSLIEKLPEG